MSTSIPHAETTQIHHPLIFMDRYLTDPDYRAELSPAERLRAEAELSSASAPLYYAAARDLA
jgi:hypothetical protein